MKKNFESMWKICAACLSLAICDFNNDLEAMNKTENSTITEEFRSLVELYACSSYSQYDTSRTARMLKQAHEINESYADKDELRRSWNILLRKGLRNHCNRQLVNSMFEPCSVQKVWSMLEPDTVLTYYMAAFYHIYTQRLRSLSFKSTPDNILVDSKEICAKRSLMIKVILLCYASKQPEQFLADFESRVTKAKTCLEPYKGRWIDGVPNVFEQDIKHYTSQFEQSGIGNMPLNKFLTLCREICFAEDPGAPTGRPEDFDLHCEFNDIIPFNCPILKRITQASVDLGRNNELCTYAILSSGIMAFTDAKIVYELYVEPLMYSRPYHNLEMYCFFPALFIKVVRELNQRYLRGGLAAE